MTDLNKKIDDATLVPADRRADLIPSHIVLRRELNELEQANILTASVWALQRRHDPIREAFARKLHRRMFRKVWRWAGKYRTTETNLGVDRTLIQPRLYEVLDNTRFWIDNKTFPPGEIAVRFHHALVSVHPFPDGNGRWSRLMADVLTARLGRPRFTWGGGDLGDAAEMRQKYIDTLKAADNHEFAPLLAFARS
ncbi:MAG TPA: mobile mystery protein B [Bradyrhizobium sp.]|nr:mobile mystery protein B [Bradyrhizobium sp.]